MCIIPAYMHAGSDLKKLTTPGAAFPHSIEGVIKGVESHRGQAVIAVGLMILIATPIMRVAASVIAFAFERDLTYVWITAVVLVVLIASFLLGKVE